MCIIVDSVQYKLICILLKKKHLDLQIFETPEFFIIDTLCIRT